MHMSDFSLLQDALEQSPASKLLGINLNDLEFDAFDLQGCFVAFCGSSGNYRDMHRSVRELGPYSLEGFYARVAVPWLNLGDDSPRAQKLFKVFQKFFTEFAKLLLAPQVYVCARLNKHKTFS